MLQRVKPLPSHDNDFAQASKGFFKGKGLAGIYTYSSPNFPGDVVDGAAIFTKWISTASSYYPKKNEETLIRETAPTVLSLCRKFNILVDLGCGTAFMNKIRPFLADADYSPIDTNEAYLDEVTKQCNKAYPEKMVHQRQLDFMTDRIHAEGIPFSVMLGCTITNFGTTDSVRKIFRQVKPLVEQGNGSFIFTHDTNTNPVSLKKTYTHDLIAKATLNVLHRMKRDLPTMNFNPNAFRFHGYWEEPTSTFNLSMYPKNDMNFSIDGEWFDLKKDQILPQAPLMKLPSEQILALAQAEGYSHCEPIYDRDKKIVLQHVHL